MRKVLVLTVMVLALMAPPVVSTALAEENVAQQVEALSMDGAVAFRAGNFEAAIEYFTAAYDLQPVPNLLYNIGRCYEQLEDWDQAISYFERFIRSPDVDREAREQARSRVESLREIQAAERPPEEPRIEEEEEEVITAPATPNRTPAFAALGSGVALLGGGAVMGVMARNQASQITDMSLSYDDRLAARDSARTQALVADVLFGAGVVATGVGVYLLLTAGSDDAAPGRAVAPWVGAGSAGVGLHLDF